jgi:hypothetical protein
MGVCSRRRRSTVNRLTRAALSLLAAPRPVLAEDYEMVRRVRRLVPASPAPRYVIRQGQARSDDGSHQVAVERPQPMVRIDRGGSRQIVRSRFPAARPADEVAGALDYDSSGAWEHPEPDGST